VTESSTVSTLLADPDSFVNGAPHDLLTELRRTTPVAWQEMPGEPGFFAVLTHAHVVQVARQPNLFSASEGGIMLEDSSPEMLEMSRNMLVVMDPPRHHGYRDPVSPSFRRRVIGGLEPQIRSLCRDIMGETAAKGPDVEFVHDVIAGLPTQVMGRLMGLPEADWPRIHELSELMLAGQDPDSVEDATPASIELATYAMGFAAARRAEPPRGDVTDVLLGSEFDGHLMTDVDFATFFAQLVAAGNDTTKTLATSGLLALLQHPDQLAELRADHDLIPGAVEEVLRFSNPIHYMRRTATADTAVGGVDIAVGQKVAMYYTSANRDEGVFDNPQRFDIHRHPNPHLAFGVGQHFCLGVHLARLEGRVFFEELLTAFPRIELAGEPVRLRSNFNNAYKRLPVRLQH
jgi:cytochrome P450